MPEISRFYGIIIRMFFNDHLPPHFHASYSDYSAQIDIRTGDIINGELPRRALRLVQDWTELHRTGAIQIDALRYYAPTGLLSMGKFSSTNISSRWDFTSLVEAKYW